MPTFIHSSFRTSSTWIWSKFRADCAVLAYYEYFHEILETISISDVDALRPGAWESRHPDVEPYFVEYLPLLGIRGGVKGFRETMTLAKFFPADGYSGPLSKAEAGYINLLIANAARLRRAPYFCCKRSLGRMRALKRAVGGTHIVLQRKLLHQWHSYSEQAKRGNSYFLNTLLRTVALNEHEPFMAILGNFIRSRVGSRKNTPASELADDDIFVIFVAFHFYLYLLTSNEADFVIRTSDLVNPDYRRIVESELKRLTGVDIDLSDARERIVSPRSLLVNPERARLEIEAFCARALREAGKSVSQVQSCWRLLDQLWADERNFRVGTNRS